MHDTRVSDERRNDRETSRGAARGARTSGPYQGGLSLATHTRGNSAGGARNGSAAGGKKPSTGKDRKAGTPLHLEQGAENPARAKPIAPRHLNYLVDPLAHEEARQCSMGKEYLWRASRAQQRDPAQRAHEAQSARDVR
ncbi:unnamed protein product [Gadus morhua 'NCC']